ncbi:MAG: hypothetical protein M3159_00255 [Actinomycetota bacterium]|nr:hypothetical protein [Actinomycetota bacterium]
MILGLGGKNRRPTREQLEQEAADIIAELVASGRPPPEVWRKAQEWRAAHPAPGPSWYVDENPTAAPAPVIGAALVPRVVRMPAELLADHREVGDDRPVVAAFADSLGDADDGELV